MRTATAAALLLAVALPPGLSGSRASAAVFVSTPPATVAEGDGPLTWTFASDAPGTMWGDVTWRLSTEAEWHMCGGREGSATLGAMPAGVYWVEIADEVDPGFAGAAPGLPAFDRCTEPHAPALGPLHPVELSTVTVVPATVVGPPATATVTTEVTAGPAPACRADAGRRRRLREAIRNDLGGLRAATTSARRVRWRRRLAAHRAALRASACP